MKGPMIKFNCNKLSRDKTLKNMEREGIITTHIVLQGKALIDALNKKLIEEAHEVVEAHDRNDVVSELVDVLEVIDGLCKAYGISHDEIASAKKATHQKRGGFEQGLFLQTIEMASDNPWVAHFRKSPEKYPEIHIPVK